MALSDPIFEGMSMTIWDLLIFILFISIVVAAARVLYFLIRRHLDKRIPKKSSKSIAQLVQYMIIGLALYIGTVMFLRLDISSMIVSLGIIGLAVALASQQVLQNAFAGMLISISKPYELEDWVEIGGSPTTGLGRVRNISLMFTEIRDLDGKIVTLPNSFMLSNKVVNYTQGGFVALEIPIRFEPGCDLKHVADIVLNVADIDEDILPNLKTEEKKRDLLRLLEKPNIQAIFGEKCDMRIFDPQVNIVALERTRIAVNLRIWIKDPQRHDQIVSNFLQTLRMRFENEGINLADS